MKKKIAYLAVVLVVGLIFISVTLAQRPAANVDPGRHRNLAEAQHQIAEAFEKVELAQKYYKSELGGHDEKAKELLVQASKEIKEAADYVDQHHK
jgi:F0F1-type ATP synthase membrane subunit b/b'